MTTFWWIILGIVILAIALLGVLIFAAVQASRSGEPQPQQTPTQQTQNPYRKFYDKDVK